MIAALFVQTGGAYFDLPDVDPWDAQRDARLYAGPYPVVAHPPCSRWCRLAGLVEARWGHKKGDDDGCFASALESVRRWGGVLEHPAHSDAFKAFALPIPQRGGGWTRGLCGGWSCYVEQGRYGHLAKKSTWLYVYGVEPLPRLRWRDSAKREQERAEASGRARYLVSWCGNHVSEFEDRPRLGKKAASNTPPEFRDELLRIARLADRTLCT